MIRSKPIAAFKYWRKTGFTVRSALFLAVKHGMPNVQILSKSDLVA